MNLAILYYVHSTDRRYRPYNHNYLVKMFIEVMHGHTILLNLKIICEFC